MTDTVLGQRADRRRPIVFHQPGDNLSPVEVV